MAVRIAMVAILITGLLAGCSSGATESADISSPVSVSPSSTASASASPTPSPAPTQFTKKEAGAYYLSVICPGNAALDALDSAIFGSNKSVDFYAFSKAKRAKIKEKAKAYATEMRKEAGKLDSPPLLWPDNVKSQMNKLTDELLAEFQWGTELSKASNNRELLATWNDSSKRTTAADKIRLRLGLPSAGKGCPKG